MIQHWRTLRLPEELCVKAEQRFGSDFENLEHFLEFVLTEFAVSNVAALDENEHRVVEERLRELGYI